MLTNSMIPPTEPATNVDKTLTGIIAEPARLYPGYSLLSLRLPAGLAQGVMAGRYFLARCGAQSDFERLHNWHFYGRRPLFVAGHQAAISSAQPSTTADAAVANLPDLWQLFVPRAISAQTGVDPAAQWLRELQPHAALNLLGPFGQGFDLQPHSRRLLLIAAAEQVATLFALIDPVLDQGGHVTLLVDATTSVDTASVIDLLVPQLPIAVETHVVADAQELEQQIAQAIPWADQICAALRPDQHQWLANLIRAHRFRLDSGFAQVLVQADLLCGVGACLACVVSLPSGSHTRACIHGPVMDLTKLTT